MADREVTHTTKVLIANDGTPVEPAIGQAGRLIEQGYRPAPVGTLPRRTNERTTPKRVRWQWEDD